MGLGPAAREGTAQTHNATWRSRGDIVRWRSHDSKITLLYKMWRRSAPCCSLSILEGLLIEDAAGVPLGVVTVEGGQGLARRLRNRHDASAGNSQDLVINIQK